MAKLSASQIKTLAKTLGQIPDKDLDTMVAIALRESGGDTAEQNKANSNGTWDSGLWQVNDIWKGENGTSNDLAEFRQQMLDGNRNAGMAGHIYRTQGLSAWTVYKSGAYKSALAEAKSGESLAQGAGLGDVVGAVASNPLDAALEGVDAVAAAVAQVGDSLSGAVEWLTDPNTWKRIALVVAGLGLVYVGVNAVARPIIEPAAKSVIGAIK